MTLKATAIIAAAGKGLRMGGKTRKQYLAIAGIPVLARTLMVFNACPAIDRIIAVIPQEDFDFCKENVLTFLVPQKPVDLVPGGDERQASVYKGICAVDDSGSIVVVHDGVRPFVSKADIVKCIRAAETFGAAIVGVPAQDTLKILDDEGCIDKTIERRGIWQAQTPQAFECRLLKTAHETASREGFTGTDDAALVERLGRKIKMVKGQKFNIKITTPEDVLLAEALIRLKADLKISNLKFQI
jgi:2-C-methyl-D-erythritol 4-phosphate cytidylyltransferase